MAMDKKAVFKDYIDRTEVLIVDKNPGSRNRLLKIMVDLGSKRTMVHSVGTIAEAQEVIKTKKVGLVLSDYFVGGGSGFELFKIMRESDPKNKQLCLVLVTSNISQTAVAKAAEEDVDSFIIKPYTIQSIQENLVSTITAKVQPSDYILKVEEGKNYITAGEYEKAHETLLAATKLHPRPALALFYLGQADYLKNMVGQAQGNYKKGLSFNNIHYKCLIGLYEVFMREGKFYEAYDVVKKVAKYFPANPDRLTQIVRLAIQTQNYSDMQLFYEIFTTLEERSSSLVNYIGAGMYISGKHCLINNDVNGALQYFDNIAVSCSEFSKFVRAMITLLVEYQKPTDAERYLSRFPIEAKDSEDFLVSDFLVDSSLLKDKPSMIVKKGLELYNKNVRDFYCMQALIHAMEASGLKQDKITEFKSEVSKLWPDKAAAA